MNHFMHLAIAVTLIGAMIGLRFTAFALVPATIFTIVVAALSLMMRGGSFGGTAVQLTLLVTCLQTGYLSSAPLQVSIRRALARGRIERLSERLHSRIHSPTAHSR